MKAYKAWDTESLDNASTIVFAESASVAKSIATETYACEDAEFVNIRVSRLPEFDSHYRGAKEIDWDNPSDRKAMVELGWTCIETSLECDTCIGKSVCGRWTDAIS
jgi:hypothetical protein